ncbi:hypothetical protein CDAR_475831 [Caerostris darwini]|uniref:Uncharacterized protein n=1 Tax=Caerostris darwini TaxID=1538125 RepID=A0AAV4PBX7_9ARAC|nr:hypothetical protein CDAR_475831 [Caerostris darwini]
MNPRFLFFIWEDGESDGEKSGSRHHPVSMATAAQEFSPYTMARATWKKSGPRHPLVSMATAAQEFSPYMVCWRQTMRGVMGGFVFHCGSCPHSSRRKSAYWNAFSGEILE